MTDSDRDDPGTGGRVDWRPWGEDAFAAAERAGKPVLLSLAATWSRECAEMDAETYAEPRIAANVGDGFVPIRADVDRHPRVADRYNVGGFPSTAFLTPDGEVLTAAGYLTPDGMRGAIDGARRAWDAKGTEAGRVPRELVDQEPPGGDLDSEIEGHLVEVLRQNHDERGGGWGTGAKFPMPRTIEFGLKREREMALRALDAVNANLLDEYGGGFYRSADNPDWSEVRYEKLLDTNASLVRAFANAYLYTGEDSYREPAERGIEYLTTTLWVDDAPSPDGEGAAFGASQAAGRGAEYYTLEPTDREDAEAPPVDRTVLANWNALAIDALLTYAAYTDDERARRYAQRALEYATTALVEDGRVIHYRERGGGGSDSSSEETGDAETGERGLLVDHAHVVRALVRARSVLGADAGIGRDPVELAEGLAEHALDDLKPGTAFVDGPREGPGLLDRPLRPLDGNVAMAEALLNLHEVTGDDRYREAARDAVEAFAGAHERFGPQAAAFGSVAGRLLRGTLRIDVTASAGSDLHRAALRIADHEAVVVPEAGDRDDSYESGMAYVVADGDPSEPAATPEELSERIEDRV